MGEGLSPASGSGPVCPGHRWWGEQGEWRASRQQLEQDHSSQPVRQVMRGECFSLPLAWKAQAVCEPP